MLLSPKPFPLWWQATALLARGENRAMEWLCGLLCLACGLWVTF